MRESVKAFLLRELDRIALERVYIKGETKDLADAREVIQKAFVTLWESYGTVPKDIPKTKR